MAENKRSFLLYTDVHHTVKKLSDDQAGKLFKHILSYVNDENPITNDVIIDLVFEPIKQSLKRDLRRYEEIIEKRSLAGKIGGVESGESRRKKKEAKEANALKRKQTKQRQANEADSVSVSVSDSVNVIVKEEKKEYAPFVFMLKRDYDKLVIKNGECNTKKFIDKLNNYKGSTGKKYKDDYLTILNWVVDEVLKENKLIKPDVFDKYLKVN